MLGPPEAAPAPVVRKITLAVAGEERTYTVADPGLSAPGSYQLTFTADGYQTATLKTSVTGGTQRYQPTVLLGTSTGTVSGTVTDGTRPLGGVSVSTSVNGKDINTGTPTTGAVGTFVLADLPTPATYVLTYSAENFTTRTVVVDLGPGQRLQTDDVVMVGGTGTVTGHLRDAITNATIGGATVTVGGTANPVTTTTVTDGDTGSFTLTGLPSPGSYTITFSKPGYADQTVPITLVTDRAPAPVNAAISTDLGSVTGVVTRSDGSAAIGVAVSATDGKHVWPTTTTSSSNGLADGGFILAQLPAGNYTVTASTPTGSVTALIAVAPGSSVTQNFTLPAGA